MKKIARKVRKTLDSLVEDGLITFAGHDLCGLCAIGSWFLCKKLKERGYKAEVYISQANNHCWTQIGKTIIDVTITQFGYEEKIFIGKKSPACYYYLGRKMTKNEATTFFEDFQNPFNKEIMSLLENRFNEVQ